MLEIIFYRIICQALISYQLQSEIYLAPESNILQNKLVPSKAEKKTWLLKTDYIADCKVPLCGWIFTILVRELHLKDKDKRKQKLNKNDYHNNTIPVFTCHNN